jgi:hypothetical protein
MAGFRQIKSPVALATFGAFLVPEPLGTCLVLLAAIWWLWRKLYYSHDADLLLELSDRNLSFYIFRAGQNVTRLAPATPVNTRGPTGATIQERYRPTSGIARFQTR